jgi:hypothetical protein
MNSRFHPPSNALKQHGEQAALPIAKSKTPKLRLESNVQYNLEELSIYIEVNVYLINMV